VTIHMTYRHIWEENGYLVYNILVYQRQDLMIEPHRNLHAVPVPPRMSGSLLQPLYYQLVKYSYLIDDMNNTVADILDNKKENMGRDCNLIV
jgi:hypothetical protein